MSNDNAIHPLDPSIRNPNVDYLGHAVSREEFEEEDTRTLCEGCGQVEVPKEGDHCIECSRANFRNSMAEAVNFLMRLKKAS